MTGALRQRRASSQSVRVRVMALMAGDLLFLSGVWGFFVLLYWMVADVGYSPRQYLAFWPVGPLYVFLNTGFRLYGGSMLHPSLPLSPVEEFRRLVCSSLLLHVGVMSFLGFSRLETEVSRLVLVCSCVTAALFAQSVRDAVRGILKRFDVGQTPVVVLGSGSVAQSLVADFAASSYFGVKVLGYFDRDGRALGNLPRLGGVRDVVRISRQLAVRRLVVCEDQRVLRTQLSGFATHFTHVDYFPEASAFPISGARPLSVDGLGGIEMVNQLQMPVVRFQKALLDWVLSIFALVLLTPFFIVIPLLIKLTSRGPVFYRQHRLGRKGRPFLIWKFRTMYHDADRRLERILDRRPDLAGEWERKRKLSNDPRVTPFGRFLRRTSLDEIPQIFNVFGGEMSLIGPRPIVEDEVWHYGSRYDVFSRVKPGVTGLWQSQGRSDTDYSRRVALDIYYVLNWNIWLDLWICLRTVFSVVTMRGAL